MESEILKSLNSSQKRAATHIDGPLLIIAGAGSGKTKTLTSRLAFLIDEKGVDPKNTLTLTFTNKAAQEMEARAMALIKTPLENPPLLCTFHKFGLIFLKKFMHFLARDHNFTLLDTTDRHQVMRDLQVPRDMIFEAENFISNAKNHMIFPPDARRAAKDDTEKYFAQIYEKYEINNLQKNLVDFDDLLLLPWRILSQNQDLARKISKRYFYVMIDEYQDTNALQLALVKQLCMAHKNLCVVGDDDQCIYTWRGAVIENILNFEGDFGAQRIEILENYRCKAEILNAANILISHNKKRLGKTLVPTRGQGGTVEVVMTFDERDEAQKIAKKIKNLIINGVDPKEIAILFRVNALSRGLEELLTREKITHELIGVQRFYERSEIKDIISYLRYLAQKNDDFSLYRIINVPRRGIGEASRTKIFETAEILKKSVWQCFFDGDLDFLSAKNTAILHKFFALCDFLREFLHHPPALLKQLLANVNFLANYKDKDERAGNIDEFCGKFYEFFDAPPPVDPEIFVQTERNLFSPEIAAPTPLDPKAAQNLNDFLSELPLHSDLDTMGDSVKCMSVHASKGLEFQHVFVIGMNDDLFPVTRNTARLDAALEEERRLCYVAFTRAKQGLYLYCANSRFLNGQRRDFSPSIFLTEAKVLTTHTNFIKKFAPDPKNRQTYAPTHGGKIARHKVFGDGILLDTNGDGICTINFGGSVKKISKKFIEIL